MRRTFPAQALIDANAIPVVLPTLHHDDPKIRSEAMYVLANIMHHGTLEQCKYLESRYVVLRHANHGGSVHLLNGLRGGRSVGRGEGVSVFLEGGRGCSVSHAHAKCTPRACVFSSTHVLLMVFVWFSEERWSRFSACSFCLTKPGSSEPWMV
jgi:hypothetical protein